MYKIGIPAVAGRSGGIIAIVPGRMGIATYSPPLDAAGISVRGQRAIKYLGQALQISLYPNWQ
jgi:glutaminase